MEISISKENLARINHKVEKGLYPSTDAVIERALDFLDQYDTAAAKVRDMAMAGLEDLRNGRYKTYSAETGDALLEDIKRQALAERQRAKAV